MYVHTYWNNNNNMLDKVIDINFTKHPKIYYAIYAASID